MSIALVALALLGHAALWVGVVNRWHAIGLPRRVIKTVTLAFYAALVVLPLAVALDLFARAADSPSGAPWFTQLNWSTAYVAFCAAFGAVHLPVWAARRLRSRRLPASVRLQRARVVDMVERLGASPARGPRAEFFCRLPFNQIWQLQVAEFDVEIPRLPSSLEGLSLCHIADLHYSGRIDRTYYEEIVRLTNAMQVDLIALTGDVCDRERYIEWIPDTLGALHARLGKFYILGNHDLRIRAIDRLRGVMRESGLVDVGGRHETVGDGAIVMAGDERPWFKASVPNLAEVPSAALRILLAHTPDQLKWARSQQFDLMFAGHTHGGQVRFPIIGPVVCPSWHGTRYAAGFFQAAPTLLHVSRGTAGLFPYRLNCRPELTRLVLHRAT